MTFVAVLMWIRYDVCRSADVTAYLKSREGPWVYFSIQLSRGLKRDTRITTEEAEERSLGSFPLRITPPLQPHPPPPAPQILRIK